MAKTKAKKKSKNLPIMPVRPRKPPVKENERTRARRTRIEAIRDRTRRAQAAIDALAAGADVSDLDHLPVMVATGPKKPPKSWRDPTDADDDYSDRPQQRVSHENQDIYLPRTKKVCGSCKRLDHPGITCKELTSWLALSERALHDELTEVDLSSQRFADQVARSSKKRGRRPKEREMATRAA